MENCTIRTTAILMLNVLHPILEWDLSHCCCLIVFSVEFLEKGGARHFNPLYWEKHIMIQSPATVTLLLLPVVVLFAQDLYNVEGTQIFKHMWRSASVFPEGFFCIQGAAQKAVEQQLHGTGQRLAQPTVPTESVSPGLPADLKKTI